MFYIRLRTKKCYPFRNGFSAADDSWLIVFVAREAHYYQVKKYRKGSIISSQLHS